MSGMDQTLEAEVGSAAAKIASSDSRASPLSAKSKFLYSFGDLADTTANASLFNYLFFYLTAVCGLPGTYAGAALFISLAIDAVADPLIGYLSDNTRSKWGRRHPYILGTAIPFALAFGLLFSIPKFDSVWLLFSYALVLLIALRVALSFFILPYASIGAELTSDYAERSIILAYRNFFAIVAQLAVAFLGVGYFLSGDGRLIREDYADYGWAGAALILIGTLVAGISSLNLRHRLYQVADSGRLSLKRFLGEMIDIFRNRSFLVLFLTVLVFWVAQAVFLQLSLHAFTYYWHFSTEWIAFINYVTIGGLFIGIPACAVLVRYVEKRDISIWGLVVVCIVQAVPAAAVMGLLPAPPAVYYLIAGFGFFGGIATTCVGISFGSMMADSADEHEHIFGVRREALYLAGLTFSWKAALGIGGLIAGVALDLIGFPSDIAERPDQIISPETLDRLALIYGPGAALISAISAVILIGYQLNKKKLTQIQSELAIRRAKSS